MRIAIASGKGGTGKTTLAVNLAYFNRLSLFDLDVEEPNDHIFIKGERLEEVVTRKVPRILEEKCDFCGKCRDVCEYSAIVVLKDRVYTFPELCHSCGACSYFCPRGAIEEVDREIGKIITVRGEIELTYGILEVGEASPIPLIRAVKRRIGDEAVIDCPPGTSCPMVESVRDSDVCVLVCEPTPFSLHDLRLSIDVVRKLGLRYCIVINKYGLPYDVESKIDAPVVGKIPFKREIAEKYSKGELLFEYEHIFCEIYDRIREVSM